MGEWEVELHAFPEGRHDAQADCFTYAALDVTAGPTIDHDRLAEALEEVDAELAQSAPWLR